MPEETSKIMPPFAEVAKLNRGLIKGLAQQVKAMHEHEQFLLYEPSKPDYEEMHANITLCYRHLEDAAMRLGKAIQAFDGGVSIYDK
jgi:hypothetical protein